MKTGSPPLPASVAKIPTVNEKGKIASLIAKLNIINDEFLRRMSLRKTINIHKNPKTLNQ